MRSPKITACYVIYNEEKLLPKSLDSVKVAVDEIIVAHDGPCKDKSIDIAKKYGAKTLIMPRVGEAEPHKPHLFKQVKSPWILMLDADEYLSSNLKKNLKKVIKDNPDCNGFAFQHEVMYKGEPLKRVGIAKGYRTILFKKDRYDITGMPHDEPKIKGKVKKIDLLLHHRPLYDNYSIETFRTKWIKWTKVQAEFMVKKKKANKNAFFYLFKAPLWFVVYFLYYLIYAKAYKNGIAGIKISFLQGLYNLFLNYYLFKLKLQK